MAWNVIPAGEQRPGELMGGFWVVLQAWPIANLYSIGLLGPEGMKITGGGYGGWTIVEVPRDLGITEWKARPNYEATLDLLFDGWITHPIFPALPASFKIPPSLPLGVRHSTQGMWLEAAIKNLEYLATPHPDADMVTPPSIRVYGAVPHTEVRWVINGLEWGDAIRDKVTGRRMRQQVTVKLVQYNQPTDLAKLPRTPPKPPFRVNKDKDKRRPWTVVKTQNGKVVARFSTQKSANADCQKRIKAAQRF